MLEPKSIFPSFIPPQFFRFIAHLFQTFYILFLTRKDYYINYYIKRFTKKPLDVLFFSKYSSYTDFVMTS